MTDMAVTWRRFCPKRGDRQDRDREQDARLESAEQDLYRLKQRVQRACWVLEDRRKRNHWREAIEQMIRKDP